jgi:hypothetical protein
VDIPDKIKLSFCCKRDAGDGVDIKPHEHKGTNRWYVIAPSGFMGNSDRKFYYFQKNREP